MRSPARHIAGHLLWTHSGEVWAVWAVAPSTYLHLNRRGKLDLHDRTRAQLRCLGSESMLLSMCARTDPADVVRAMVDGIDLDASPDWVEACEATLDTLTEVELTHRRHYLAVLLPRPSDGPLRRLLGDNLGAAKATVAEAFGLASPPVRTQERERRLTQAQAMGERLGRTVPLVPVTPAELRWIYDRAPRRGLDEPYLPAGTGTGSQVHAELRRPCLVSLGEATFHEGGQSGDQRGRGRRRYLKAVTDRGDSYQAFLALAEMPHEFAFPDGAEWFAGATRFDFPVDWCARIRPVANADAQVKAKRQARQLAAQVEEYAGETAGAPGTLADARDAVDDERSQLAANPGDPEFETTVVFCVWAETLPDCEARADALRDTYGASEYALERPTGGQLALYSAMLPGSPCPRAARDYTQYLMPRDLAAGMPWADSDLGDPVGGLAGYNLDHGTVTPVLVDPSYGPREQKSGSVGAVGDLGSGKSYWLKMLGWITLARGGRLVILDRTGRGEWLDWARCAPGHTQAVRVRAPDRSGTPEFSLDPLRVFTGAARIRTAAGFLQLLTTTSSQDLQGIALQEAVQAVAGRGGRLVDVIAELHAAARSSATSTGTDRDGAYDVARRLEVLRAEPLAQLVFSDAAPLNLPHADAIVFHAPDLALPDRTTLESEYLARKMLPEQILSQALVYLIAAIGKEVVFSDPSTFAALVVDEAYVLTSTPQGRQLTLTTVKDGRKHNAALWVAGQSVDDLGDPEIRGLLRNRFVFRQGRVSAQRSLAWLDMDTDETVVDRIGTMDRGQCLFKDVRDRAGLLEVAGVPLARLIAGFDTNPTRAGQNPGPPGDHDDVAAAAAPELEQAAPVPACPVTEPLPLVEPAVAEPASCTAAARPVDPVPVVPTTFDPVPVAQVDPVPVPLEAVVPTPRRDPADRAATAPTSRPAAATRAATAGLPRSAPPRQGPAAARRTATPATASYSATQPAPARPAPPAARPGHRTATSPVPAMVFASPSDPTGLP